MPGLARRGDHFGTEMERRAQSQVAPLTPDCEQGRPRNQAAVVSWQPQPVEHAAVMAVPSARVHKRATPATLLGLWRAFRWYRRQLGRRSRSARCSVRSVRPVEPATLSCGHARPERFAIVGPCHRRWLPFPLSCLQIRRPARARRLRAQPRSWRWCPRQESAGLSRRKAPWECQQRLCPQAPYVSAPIASESSSNAKEDRSAWDSVSHGPSAPRNTLRRPAKVAEASYDYQTFDFAKR